MRVTFLTTKTRPEYDVPALESWLPAQRKGVEFEILVDQGWGCQLAGRKAMENSLDGHDFGIVAFDDCLVAPDILDYFAYAANLFSDTSNVASVSAWRIGVFPDLKPHTYYDFYTEVGLRCGVWGTWRDTWDEHHAPFYPEESADLHFTNVVYPERGLVQMLPVWSRVQHIGTMGTHMRPQLVEEHMAKPWAADIEPPAGRGWNLVRS